ncbi:hypothetical protein RRG08_000600 [Elysia crispata]|uniref:Uncharacterized protein n=1 Tax=Elysia crispata TaxID=231223 RepID=A0AAE1CUZ0_9GAST|nr:hypothetical protein RRG08_000600 [Elysia crispata]
MVSISQASLSSKLLLGLSCVCITLHSISISQPYWLKVRKTVPANASKLNVPVLIKVHMGLYRACKNVKARIPEGTLVIEDWCRTKDAPDWHKACAGFGMVAFLFALAQNVLAFMNVTIKKVANKIVYKLISAGCCAVAVGFMIPILILFDVNRDNYRGVKYDLFYCFVLGVIGMVLYFFLGLLILVDMYHHRTESDPSEEKLWTEETNGETSAKYT